jgi:hypothetical protein
MTAAALDDRCRTCGRPRGETVGSGTRCPRCARNHALLAWFVLASGAALWATAVLDVEGSPLVVGLTTFVALPVATVAAVLIHEGAHALVGRAVGLVVTRIEVGEGRELARIGREPELVLGAIPGSGWTYAASVDPVGYRWRWIVFSLVPPLVSGTVAIAAWALAASWPLWARTAGVVFALANGVMFLVTMLPAPTFGGRVWSDLATALGVARMSDDDVRRDCVAHSTQLVQSLAARGEAERALAMARRGHALGSETPQAWTVLAFALVNAGRSEEAVGTAREALSLVSLDGALTGLPARPSGPGQEAIGSVERTTWAPASAKRANAASASSV